MAPIKFEDSIKEKLEKRRLEPSTEAWNRLSEKLETNTERSSKKTYVWIGIAASLVGIFLMTYTFFKTSEVSNQNPVLVDTETQEIETLQKSGKVNQEEQVFMEQPHMEVVGTSENVTKTNETKNESITYSVKTTQVAQTESPKASQKILKDTLHEPLSRETEIAQTETQEHPIKTETDVDALLKEAQQKLKHTTTEKDYAIDAKALLQDVEADLDESFRAKVFETLITGYKKVKTAVAQRNQ